MILSFDKEYSDGEEGLRTCPLCGDKIEYRFQAHPNDNQLFECRKCGWFIDFADGMLIELSIGIGNGVFTFVSSDSGIWQSRDGNMRIVPALVKYVEGIEFVEAVKGLREAGERLMVLV
jgi:hypothetical protein